MTLEQQCIALLGVDVDTAVLLATGELSPSAAQSTLTESLQAGWGVASRAPEKAAQDVTDPFEGLE